LFKKMAQKLTEMIRERIPKNDYFALRNIRSVVDKHLFDFLLMEIFSPIILKKAKEVQLPSYVKRHIPQPLLEGMPIADYYQKKAIDVLEGYQSCQSPYPVSSSAYTETSNLLSPKGEDFLSRLKQEKLPEELTIQASNKVLLNLDFFKDLSDFEKMPFIRHHEKEKIKVAATAGCYNQCCHCGYPARKVVSHMRYPVLLKVLDKIGDVLYPREKVSLYADSDPLAYRDPIIAADMADVVRFLKTDDTLKWERPFNFVTKGPIFKEDAYILAELSECSNICLSFVNLRQEQDISRNMERIEMSICTILNTVSIERRYSPLAVMEYRTDKKMSSLEEKYQNNPHISFYQIRPYNSGRYHLLKRDGKLLPSEEGIDVPFAGLDIILFDSDGAICKACYDSCNHSYTWQKVAHIFPVISRKTEPRLSDCFDRQREA